MRRLKSRGAPLPKPRPKARPKSGQLANDDALAEVVDAWPELPDHVRDLVHRLAGGKSTAPESRSSDRTRSDELRGGAGAHPRPTPVVLAPATLYQQPRRWTTWWTVTWFARAIVFLALATFVVSLFWPDALLALNAIGGAE